MKKTYSVLLLISNYKTKINHPSVKMFKRSLSNVKTFGNTISPTCGNIKQDALRSSNSTFDDLSYLTYNRNYEVN